MRRLKNTLRQAAIWVVVILLLAVAFETVAKAAEEFPTRPVEFIVPTRPGGGTDIIGRILAEVAGEFLGQKLVVINKPGASGSIGVSELVTSRPDGYKIGIVYSAPMTMVPHTLKVPYKPDDFTYITQITQAPLIYCVRNDFPAEDAKEFFKYVKKNPGKLTYGNEGIGGSLHLAGERIFRAMDVKLRPVPFPGTGAIVKAFLGGHIDVAGGSVQPMLPHVQAGTIRCLFCSTKEAVEVMPEMMGLAELGIPEVATVSWRGIFGPKGIPSDRVEILRKAFHQAAQSKKFRDTPRLRPETGEKIVISTSRELEELVRSEFNAMKTIAKDLGLGQQK
jgi:tripartite-type tricarboxylate transporter receptor subunit TctC